MNRRGYPIRWAALVGVLLSAVLVRTGSLALRHTPTRMISLSDLCVSETAEQRVHRPWCHRPNARVDVDPFSLPPDPIAPIMSRADAIARASGKPSDNRQRHPAYARLMLLSDYERATGDRESPLFDHSRPVWIVTVHEPAMTEGGLGTPPVKMAVHSVVLDAATGEAMSGCIGCSLVRADGSLVAVGQRS